MKYPGLLTLRWIPSILLDNLNFCCILCMCRSLVLGHCACAGSADRPGGAAGEGADLGPGRPVHPAQGEQGPRGDTAHRRRWVSVSSYSTWFRPAQEGQHGVVSCLSRSYLLTCTCRGIPIAPSRRLLETLLLDEDSLLLTLSISIVLQIFNAVHLGVVFHPIFFLLHPTISTRFSAIYQGQQIWILKITFNHKLSGKIVMGKFCRKVRVPNRFPERLYAPSGFSVRAPESGSCFSFYIDKFFVGVSTNLYLYIKM